MEFREPYKVYSAESNMESHLIVNMLHAKGIEALAVEDQSGVSLWAFGRITQFHQPDVWVEKANATEAARLIREFESEKQEPTAPSDPSGEIEVICEECEKSATYPGDFNGTTQECKYCHAYVDVGDLPWEEDFGSPED